MAHVASGLARNFGQLMAARIGVGIGEAGCTPPAHSIISDSFPPERRATALSAYQLGVPIGTLFGLIAGGYLAEELGWQAAFFVVGLPGLLLAIVAKFTLTEPLRGHFDQGVADEVEPLGKTIRFMASMPYLNSLSLYYLNPTYKFINKGALKKGSFVNIYKIIKRLVLSCLWGLLPSADMDVLYEILQEKAPSPLHLKQWVQ